MKRRCGLCIYPRRPCPWLTRLANPSCPRHGNGHHWEAQVDVAG